MPEKVVTMKSLVKLCGLVLIAGLSSYARADKFPQSVDYLVRALGQNISAPLVIKNVKLSEDISSWSTSEKAAVQGRVQALNSSGSVPSVSQLEVELEGNIKIKCLAAVVENSIRFANMNLGPYSDRAGTVIVQSCRKYQRDTSEAYSLNFEYDVILPLEKDLAFSGMSRSQTFSVVERLDVSKKKLLCMADMNKDGMPTHAVAIYKVGDYYIVGVGIETTGEIASSDSNSQEKVYDFPIGLNGMQDKVSILQEVIPTIDFFSSMKGRFQLVFRKSDCMEEGFNQDWPHLYCNVRVPEAHRKNSIEELQFRFSKTINVTREQGIRVESEVFDIGLNFISSKPSYHGSKMHYKNNLKFETQGDSRPCQF